MINFSESKPVQVLGLLILLAALATAGLYYFFYREMDEQNRLSRERLRARTLELNALRKYENDLPGLNRQIDELKQQLEIQKHIVPDEQEADQFMHLMQDTAQSAGIEIRRWTSKPAIGKEFYTEVPFDLELDGPFYAVLTFFDKVSKLERIINVSNLQLGAVKGDTKLGHGYRYSPRETVIGLCTATTFFSHEPSSAPGTPANPPQGKK
jgi:type IV pilus assembly protein PilO